MAGKTFHVHLGVRDAIQWPDKKLRGMCRDENGDRLSPRQVRDWLFDHLSEGHEVIPVGEACAGFDYKSGCPGHVSAGVSGDGRGETP